MFNTIKKWRNSARRNRNSSTETKDFRKYKWHLYKLNNITYRDTKDGPDIEQKEDQQINHDINEVNEMDIIALGQDELQNLNSAHLISLQDSEVSSIHDEGMKTNVNTTLTWTWPS